MTRLLQRLLATQRKAILSQARPIAGLMPLLMKVRNTGVRWTPDELRQIRAHLKALAKLVPILMVFVLPGGLLLLPILAEVLDRRSGRR
jgi:hypothetical protein